MNKEEVEKRLEEEGIYLLEKEDYAILSQFDEREIDKAIRRFTKETTEKGFYDLWIGNKNFRVKYESGKFPEDNSVKWICRSCGTEIIQNKKPKKCSCGSEKIERKKKLKPKFNYETKKEKDIKTLGELREVIKRNFPDIWLEVKACLSTYATISLKNINGCPSLNLIGNPSGEKTTVLSFFYGQRQTYMSDDFTPRSFVSHSANATEEELEKIDLLPKIKNKILLTPELAPLFEAPRDKLVDNFGILTRVLDGEGLNRDTGMHGHRGYSGDYKFAWIGASTPLRASVWKVMGKIGNRLFFLNMQDKNRDNQDYLNMFLGKSYEEKIKECRGAVRSYLDNLFNEKGIRSLEWDSDDKSILLEIIKYAKMLSKLRASLMTWKSEEKGEFEYNFPLVEEPPRAINSLYNLAKGHAIINNRSFLKREDLEIVKAVTFSSMPHDRHEFLKLLAKHEGKLTAKQIEKELGCSQDTALRTMKTFEVLGIVEAKNMTVDTSGEGRPMKYIEIKEEFEELLNYAQGQKNEIKSKSQENKSAPESYDNLKSSYINKNQEQAHNQNDEMKDKSQKNTSASNDIDFNELNEKFDNIQNE